MAGIRGDGSRGGRLLLLFAATAVLAGCAIATPTPLGAAPSASPTPSPTPTAACPQVEGVELPPDCAPYDPDEAMGENERYRDRMALSASSRDAAAEAAVTVRAALEATRMAGDISVDAVERAIARAGLSDARALGDERAVAFGVSAPDGGCIFGEVSAERLTVEIGGYIMDGGCLPAEGH